VPVDGGIGKQTTLTFARRPPAVSANARVTPRARASPQLRILPRHARVMPLATAPLGLRPAQLICNVVSSRPSPTQGREETSWWRGIRAGQHLSSTRLMTQERQQQVILRRSKLRQPHPASFLPPIEVPLSPFAFRGRKGNGNPKASERSRVRRAAAATPMTRAIQPSLRTEQPHPPAAWALIPRSRTRRSGRRRIAPATTPPVYRNRIAQRSLFT
jgi:hypothetical protein